MLIFGSQLNMAFRSELKGEHNILSTKYYFDIHGCAPVPWCRQEPCIAGRQSDFLSCGGQKISNSRLKRKTGGVYGTHHHVLFQKGTACPERRSLGQLSFLGQMSCKILRQPPETRSNFRLAPDRAQQPTICWHRPQHELGLEWISFRRSCCAVPEELAQPFVTHPQLQSTL